MKTRIKTTTTNGGKTTYTCEFNNSTLKETLANTLVFWIACFGILYCTTKFSDSGIIIYGIIICLITSSFIYSNSVHSWRTFYHYVNKNVIADRGAETKNIYTAAEFETKQEAKDFIDKKLKEIADNKKLKEDSKIKTTTYERYP